MKTSARLVTAIAVAAALLSATGCSKLRARMELNDGVQAYKAGKAERAIEHFKNAVRLDGDLRTAKLYLATAYMNQYVPNMDTPENNQNAQMAIEKYNEVLSENPSTTEKVTSLKGIASLYMNMKKYDQGADYYKKAIEADPNDPEAYYSVGVLDWTAAYNDTTERKARAGLTGGVEAPMTTKPELKLCDEIKAADQGKVDEGIKMVQEAMDHRQDYDEAMTYMGLLYRRKADLTCNDPQAAAQYKKLSEKYSDDAMAARKKKFEEASKKGTGFVRDQSK